MEKELEIQIASLDIDKFHIIGIKFPDDNWERIHNAEEVIHHICRDLKFMVVPINNISKIDVRSFTNKQLEKLCDVISKIKPDKEETGKEG